MLKENENTSAFDIARNKVLPKVWEGLTEGTAVRKPKELLEHVRSRSYTYESLPKPTCIRLLRVEPGTTSEPIRCSLRTIDLDTDPEFTALSYSWEEDNLLIDLFDPRLTLQHTAWVTTQNTRALLGWREHVSRNEYMIKLDQEMKQKRLSASQSKSLHMPQVIFCEGKTLAVQANLYCALLELRRRRPGDYWIDAVCINQKDLEERSSQVQMMGRIYQTAAEVIVWVGEMPSLLKRGFHQLSTKFEDKPGVSPSKLSKEDMGFSEMELAVIWLLSRRWFRRLWVVQESCLARRITFPVGDHDFKARDIVSTVEWMQLAASNMDYSYLAMLLSPYATHIRSVPAMLNASGMYASGRHRTLLEWLEMTMNRKARDPSDIVFAGLALVDPQNLNINPNLQLQEDDCESHTPQQKLWAVLHADYKADTTFVMTNLAACLLSNWDVDALFSITLRYRPPPARFAIAETPVYLQPSWVPDPSHWKPRPNAAPGTVHRPLPLRLDVHELSPRISSNGSVLYLTAAKFDVITGHCSLEDAFSEKTNQCTLDVLNWLANTVPTTYHPKGRSGWDTVSSVVLAKLRMLQSGLLEHLSEAKLRLGLCLAIRQMVKDACKHAEKSISSSKPGLRTLLDPTRTWTVDAARIKAAYEEVKAKHASANWPTYGEIACCVADLLKSDSDQQSQVSSEEANNEPKLINAEDDDIGLLTDLEKFFNETNNDSETPSSGIHGGDVATSFHIYYYNDLITQSMFMTSQGYIGIGPNSLRDGDTVFLIPGGNIPYILRHTDDALRMRCIQIREQLERKPGKAAEEALRREWQDAEEKIGKRDRWELVGDAYVEGIMDGEVAAEMEEKVQRYGVV